MSSALLPAIAQRLSSGFTVCINRGAQQIGGTCVEPAYGGTRLLLDLGLPLNADPHADSSPLLSAASGLLDVVLSQSHADHWGLLAVADPSRPPAYAGVSGISCAAERLNMLRPWRG
jgi:ribonuclease J